MLSTVYDALCIRAWLALERGEVSVASRAVEEASAIATRLGTGPGSPLGDRVASVRAAVADRG